MFELIESLGKDGLEYAYELIQKFTIYLIVLVLALLLISYFVVRKNKEKLVSFKTLWIGIIVGFAVTYSLIISLFMISRSIVKGKIDFTYLTYLIFLSIIIATAIFWAISSVSSKKWLKTTTKVFISISTVYTACLTFFMQPADSEFIPLSSFMYVFTALLVATMVLLIFLFDKEKYVSTTYSISFAGIVLALSFVLSYVKVSPPLLHGGSVTLASALPIIIYAYIFGAKKGVAVGIIYGLLQLIQKPEVYQPMQVLIDYPIAFGSIGLAGIVKNFKLKPIFKFLIGATVGLFFRYLAHVISGYYVFYSWAWEGFSPLGYSFVYNLYVIADLGIVLVVGTILFLSKGFNRELAKMKPQSTNK